MRLFVALGCTRRMLSAQYKDCWTPFFTVDGADTTQCGATMLFLVIKDGDGRVVPLAIAFVKSESTASWTWFLEQARDAYDMLASDGVVIMGDGAEAISAAVMAALPAARRMYCLKHRLRNIARTFAASGTADALYSNFARAAFTYHVTTFRKAMVEIELLGQKELAYVQQRPANTWSNAHVCLLTGGCVTSNDAGERQRARWRGGCGDTCPAWHACHRVIQCHDQGGASNSTIHVSPADLGHKYLGPTHQSRMRACRV